MDELYIESFSKQEKTTLEHAESVNSPVIEDTPIETFEFNYQMLSYLDQLEKAIKNVKMDFTDFSFIFDKIKKKIKEEDFESIITLLNDLEEFFDIELPKINLREILTSTALS